MKNLKKLLFVMMTVAVVSCLFAICSVTGSAAGIIASGECGKGGDSSCDGNKNISWTLDSDGLLVISGTGDMNFHQYDCDPYCWLNLAYKIKSVVIEDGITSIGGSSFAYCVNLANIKIPDSVTTIGDYAFSGCSGLTEINIPDSVTTIGDCAFSGCKELTEITIPESVENIGYEAFYGCNALTKIIWNSKNVNDFSEEHLVFEKWDTSAQSIDVVFGDSVEKIPNNLFCSNKWVTSVTISDSVTTIGDGAFSGCSGLTEINIPDSVTTIGAYAFSGCSGLTEINILDSVTTIGAFAFQRCSQLMQLTINARNFTVGTYAFFGCGSDTEGMNVIFGDSVELIPDRIMSNEVNIKSLSIGKNVKSIGDGAFIGCSGLTEINIPDSVTTIGDYAFSGCSGLTEITIPDSVITIGNYTFRDCTKLNSVVIGNAVTEIGTGAFSDCLELQNIAIPDSVEYIGASAFSGTGLEQIIINNPKCVIEYNADTIPVDAVIYGHVNSPAQMYAQMYGRDFAPLAAVECEHSYGEWIIDADATCTQRGFSHRVCTICNGYEFNVIDETGHTDEDSDCICDACDVVITVQTPDTDNDNGNGHSTDNGITSFFESLKELFNKIIAWFKSVFANV